MTQRFVISDLHLGHSGVARLRGYPYVEQHDEAIRHNWISAGITKRDIVYILGDVTMHNSAYSDKCMVNLPGRKILVAGNHDDKDINDNYSFESVYGAIVVKVRKQAWVMTHIPIHPMELVGTPGCRSRWVGNIHGHLHDDRVKNSQGYPDARYVNVCCEQMNMQPQLLENVVPEIRL